MEESKIEEELLIEERKKKLINFLKKEQVYVFIALFALIILGVYIRTLPMQNHDQNSIPSLFQFLTGQAFDGKPGLWDYTTSDWTLGPDLDPWLFTRYAKTIIESGSLPKIDELRNVPLGFDTTTELQMVSYMIVLTYHFVNFFGDYDIMFAAVFMPVILFALTILSFFFFVREIFIKKEESILKANIIATISTLFMIVIPIFLSRTIAGIPEKESVAFFFMFLSFYLFLRAWKTEKMWISACLGILAGISTALMGLTWGGVLYVYITIAISMFVAFFLGKVRNKEMISYGLWIFFSVLITLIFTNRFSLSRFITSLDTGMAVFVFFVIIVDFILWRTKIKDKFDLILPRQIKKIPPQIISLGIAVILAIIIILLLFGPSILIDKWVSLNQMLFRPISGRWVVTVAENRQPYFWEWASNFGPSVGNFPILLSLALIGVILLFYQMLNKVNKKERMIITSTFGFFIIGLIFSRYSNQSIFNGENLISKSFYYFSVILFVGVLIYHYVLDYKKNESKFDNINFGHILLIALFIFCIFTARSAIRLVMTLGPIIPIFMAWLFLLIWVKIRDTKKVEVGDISNFLYWLSLIATIALLGYCFFGIPFNGNYPGFYQQIKSQAYGSVPYYYNFQWQNAMSWIRNNTSSDSVFAHWWDYGYWLQSIGNRATVTDGGNAIVWWNYLSGRYILTGDNQNDALDFLYAHNATHLLIDSSDLGKYGAFSSIGSNEQMDRFSQGPVTFLSNDKMVQEKASSIVRIYQIPSGDGQVGVSPIEEDVYYNNNGTVINLLTQDSGIIGILIEGEKTNQSKKFKQPIAVFVSKGKQINIPLRYLKYGDEFYDFESGLDATAYVIQKLNQNSVDPMGAVMYISPRLMRGFLSQVYILDDPFKKFQNFKLVHTEPNVIIDSLNKQNPDIGLSDFVHYGELQGPIKIWKILYNGNEELKLEYTARDYSEYISWQL